LRLLELCQKVTSIDSTVSHGTAALTQVLSDWAWQNRLYVEVVEDQHHGVPQKILIVRPSDRRAPKDLVLSASQETRDPGSYANWVKNGGNPFYATIEGDHLFGLGVCDQKIDLVAKLAALSQFSGQDFSVCGPVVVGGFGGETAPSVLRILRRRLLNPMMALTFGQTGLQVGDRAPGYAEIQIHIPYSDEERTRIDELQYKENASTQTKLFKTQGALSGELDFTENPISQMFSYLKHLPDGLVLVSVEGGQHAAEQPDQAWLELEIADGLKETMIRKLVRMYEHFLNTVGSLRQLTDPDFVPKCSTMNLGKIESRPDGITISGTCRFVPRVGPDIYNRLLSELKLACEALGGRCEVIDFREPFIGRIESRLGLALRSGLERRQLSVTHTVSRQCGEANLFDRFNVNTLAFGAARPADFQVSSERVSIKDLEKSIDVYQDVIREVCA
jgi:acetylornithine deacetylase/succinyl-diaminopimelate desuccinylase-like protein